LAERRRAEVEAAIDTAAALIEAAASSGGTVALACHVSPDGDALGSLLALHLLCRDRGVASVAGWSEPFEVAPHYRYLPGLDTCTKPADYPPEPSLLFTFDSGSLRRLGDLEAPAAWARDHGDLVVVDHHGTNDRFGTCNLVDDTAAATAVLVRDLVARLRWPLSKDVATCLYTGLVTDTGRFQYASTTPAVFELAEELSSFGLPLAAITRQLFEQHRFAYLQLAGRALARARLRPDASLVLAWLTAAELADADVCVDEAEGLIDIVRRTAEADVACVCKETSDGVRVSLRSVTHQEADGSEWGVDVGAIAAGLGGGGHRYAAGFSSDRPVDEVLTIVEDAVRAAGPPDRPSGAQG
jgi:phosphoesterase RecJ-like protein